MNMKQMHYIVTLVKEGTFSKAAEVLKISQPSLSQFVKTMETQLGVELFIRANGSIRLTDAGKVFVEYAQKMQMMERQLYHELDEIFEFRKGSIIVGTTPFRSVAMMPKVISKFRAMYKGIDVIVDERGTQELLQGVENGEFDFCLLTLPENSNKWISRKIMEEEVVVAVSKGSQLDQKLSEIAIVLDNRKYAAIPVKALDAEDFIMITENQVMQRMLHTICETYGISMKQVARVKSLQTQLEMVRANVGASLLPTGIEKTGDSNAYVSYYSFVENFPRREVVVIYRKDQKLTKPMEDLIAIMQQIDW